MAAIPWLPVLGCCRVPMDGGRSITNYGPTARGVNQSLVSGTRRKPRTRRWVFVTAVAVTIVVGLASRQIEWVPAWIGDALWATTAYFIVSAIAPRARWWRRGAAALAFSYAIEFSQLYHQPWIDNIRATTLGHLALGSTFVWADLVAYTAGVAFGIAVIPQRRRSA